MVIFIGILIFAAIIGFMHALAGESMKISVPDLEKNT